MTKWLRLAQALLFACPVGAHVISMSSSDLKVEGAGAVWELRVPLYEIQHVAGPEKALLEHIRFESRGVPAKVVESRCEEDTQDASYRCKARLQWPEEVERLEVVCTFHEITVANHVHLLRATRGDKTDQAVFDFSNPKAEVRFRPPTAFELFVTAWGGGFARAFAGGATVLFLACLALAARSKEELLLLAGMFLVGQMGAALVLPRTPWVPAPRFVEAAMALTIAYLAVEILALPEAGQRWAVAGVLGAFHGLSTAMYLTTTGYGAAAVLSGNGMAEVLTLGIFALVGWRFRRVLGSHAAAGRTFAACVLLVTGLGWFFLRLRA
jgi:hypothetical protein